MAEFSSFLEFGSLGLLGIFLYFAYQAFKEQQLFQRELTEELMQITRDSSQAQTSAARQFDALCKGIEDNRKMVKEEHQALMNEHKTLMNDHRRITEKLV